MADMLARKPLYAVLIVATVIAAVCGLSRVRGKRVYRFPQRVVRILPAPRAQARAVAAGVEPPLAAASPVKIDSLEDFHGWVLESLRGKTTRQRLDTVFELGKTLGADDFDHAVKLSQQIPVEWMRSVLQAGIFFARGRELGARAVEELTNGDYGELRDEFSLGGVRAGWGSVDPRGALAAENEHPTWGGSNLIYAAWGFADLDAMLTGANAMPEGQQHFMEWAKADPERAVEYALTLDKAVGAVILERIAQGWAANWSEDYRPDFQSYLMLALARQSDDYFDRSLTVWWAQYDPEQAVEYAAGPGRDTDNLSTALFVWAQTDTRAAAEWMKTHVPQNDGGVTQAGDVMRSFMELGDPATAARLFDALPFLDGKSDLPGKLAESWMEQDPVAAYDWIAGKETDRDKLLQYSQTAGLSMARWNIEDALNWARQRADAELQANALSGVAFVEAYSRQDPPTDWMLALPPGASRDRCIANYVTGALEHAKGTTEPNPYILRNATGNLTDLVKSVQDSALDAAGKQRLLGLIYGWPHAP